MSDLTQLIPAGTILLIEQGEYADFFTENPLRVIKPFIKADVVAEYTAEWRQSEWFEPDYREEPTPEFFSAWLLQKGYVEPINDVHRWHVGAYNTFSP